MERIPPYDKMDIHEKINYKSLKLVKFHPPANGHHTSLRAIKNSYNYDQYKFGIIADGQIKRTFGRGAKAHKKLFRQGKYELCQKLNDFLDDRSYFRGYNF